MATRAIKIVSIAVAAIVLLAIGFFGYYRLRIAPIIKAGKEHGVFAAASGRPSVADFGYETENGIRQKFTNLKGKVIVVDVWASWCGTCIYNMPKTIELRNKYSGRAVEIIGLDVDKEGWAKAKRFLRKHPEINYTVAVPYPAPAFLIQTLVDLNPLGKVSTLPTFFVIDRHGRLAGKFVNIGHEQEIDNLVFKLLNE
jgi:thiol-disulfide isomerase/thioredoxin